MRIDTTTQKYTGDWIFDSFSLLTRNYDLFYFGNGITEEKLDQELASLMSNAVKIEKEISTLSQTWKLPSNYQLEIFISVPYFKSSGRVTLSGKTYALTRPSERLEAVQWYINRVKSEISTKSWPYYRFGLYYFREEFKFHNDDQNYIPGFNVRAKRAGFPTLWVPGYTTTKSFNGPDLGFTYTSIQPAYSFRSSTRALSVKADRLYSTGEKANKRSLCLAYEFGAYGPTFDRLFNSIAYEYLAASVSTSCYRYPQVFFSGGFDLFDRALRSAEAMDAYNDLVNYLLDPASIKSREKIIPPNQSRHVGQSKDLVYVASNYDWTVSKDVEGLNGIRMDLQNSEVIPWRGYLYVNVKGKIFQHL